MASRDTSEIEVQAADNHGLMAATSGLVSKMAIAAEPLDSGPPGIVGTLDPHERGGGGGGGGGEGIEGGFKLKGYSGVAAAASPRDGSGAGGADAASVGPGWLKPPPPIKVGPQLQQHEDGGAAGEDGDAAVAAAGEAPAEPYVVLSSHAAPKLRPFPPAASAAPALAGGDGGDSGAIDVDGEGEPEVVAVQPMQWAKVRQPGMGLEGLEAAHAAAAEAPPSPDAGGAAAAPPAQQQPAWLRQLAPGGAGAAAAASKLDVAAASELYDAAPKAREEEAAPEEEEEEAARRSSDGGGRRVSQADAAASAAAGNKWQPPARKAANPLGGAKGSLMAPANPDAEVIRASDVIEEIRSPPIRVTDLSKQLKEHFENGMPLGGNGLHDRDTVTAAGSTTPSTARAAGGTALTLTQHDLVNTANAALLLQAGEFKLKPGIDVVPYDQLKELRLEDGLDVSRKEEYLSEEEFETVFGMDKEDFRAMPPWKRINAKKAKGLF